MEPPWPVDEPARLETLKSYGVLDTPAEEVFDRITRLVSRHFDVPVALVSLVDETRQWFKARHGLDVPCTERKLAFCAYSILESRVMVVPDAAQDERFAGNALVTGPPYIRFYAGAPLLAPDGMRLGTLCAVDQRPRHDFDAGRQRDLADFAHLVMHELEGRRARAAVEAANAEAERANRAKSRFLAAASHDLRQPFQAMELLLGVLALRLGGQAGNLAMLHRVQEALHSGQGLLNGLLDIATLEAGTVEPTPVAMPICPVIDRLAREMSEQARRQGLRLRRVGCSAVVRSDPLLLERILRNLLGNALAHTRRGRVLVGCRRRADRLRIEVWDTGGGIPPEQLDLIFEEFYQLHNPERNRQKGLGLGLAIVRKTAELLGHRVGVRSVVGKGTVFFVEVPLVPDERAEAPAAAAPSSDQEGLAGHTVVVIEDEEQQRSAVAMFLESVGCRVLATGSAEEAIERLETAPQPPDAVISDFRLVGRATGLEAIAAIRDTVGRRVPAILVTGDTDPRRLRQAKRAGCALLHKPFRPEDLCRVLIRALRIVSEAQRPE